MTQNCKFSKFEEFRKGEEIIQRQGPLEQNWMLPRATEGDWQITLAHNRTEDMAAKKGQICKGYPYAFDKAKAISNIGG